MAGADLSRALELVGVVWGGATGPEGGPNAMLGGGGPWPVPHGDDFAEHWVPIVGAVWEREGVACRCGHGWEEGAAPLPDGGKLCVRLDARGGVPCDTTDPVAELCAAACRVLVDWQTGTVLHNTPTGAEAVFQGWYGAGPGYEAVRGTGCGTAGDMAVERGWTECWAPLPGGGRVTVRFEHGAGRGPGNRSDCQG